MKMLYLTLAVVIGLTFLRFAKGQRISAKSPAVQISQEKDTSHPQSTKPNSYAGLRHLALNTTPAQLHLSLPDNQTIVYGVVMDMDMGAGFGTFVFFQSGYASFYLSNGGGMIGNTDLNVRDAAKKFVSTAQTFLDKAAKTDTTPLPRKNYVGFYFLTNKGTFFADENLENIEHNSSIWTPLVDAGNKVANELVKSRHK